MIGAPAIAIEVISPGNRAQDIAKMIGQYLDSGSQSVWVVYPKLRSVEIHSASGVRKIPGARGACRRERAPRLSNATVLSLSTQELNEQLAGA